MVLLSACTAPDPGDTGSGAGSAGDGDASPTALADAVEPLRLAMVRPASFRPDEVIGSDQAAVIVADLLYDGLVEVDGAGDGLVPALARDWSADRGYRRWTFRLDPASGVEAETVADNLATLVWPPVDGDLVRSRSMAALTAGMRSVAAPDRETVVIELGEPNAGLPWILSGLPFSAIGRGGEPTGDYELAADTDSGATLRRRPERSGGPGEGSDGVGGDDGTDRSAVSEIEIVWSGDAGEAYRLLVDGVVDAAVADPASLSDAAARFGATPPPTSAVRYYVLDPRSADLDDPDRRRRVIGAVDVGGVVDTLDGVALDVADGLVPSSVAGFRPGACGEGCRAAPVDDRDGRPGDWPADRLEVSYGGPDQAAMAGAVAEQLSAAGIEAAGSEVTTRELAEAIVAGTTDLFAFGWVAPAGSADAVLPPLLGADSPANVARVASPAIEELLGRAAVTADDEERWDLLDQAHRLALDEAKILPVAVSTSTLIVAGGDVPLVVRPDGSTDLETG